MNEELLIDPSQLDEEWLKQASLFDQAQERSAECLKIRDQLKKDLDRLEAKLAQKERKDWDDKKAPTDKIIYEKVALNEGIQELKNQIVDAIYEKAKADNLVNSFEMKKRSLTKLTDLHGMNYFSVPNPTHELPSGKTFRKLQENKVEENSQKAVQLLNEKKGGRQRRT